MKLYRFASYMKFFKDHVEQANGRPSCTWLLRHSEMGQRVPPRPLPRPNPKAPASRGQLVRSSPRACRILLSYPLRPPPPLAQACLWTRNLASLPCPSQQANARLERRERCSAAKCWKEVEIADRRRNSSLLVSEMASKGGYVPPQYVPLYGLDTEEDRVPPVEENHATRHKLSRDLTQWSSGICACFDDPQSCCIGATCPCFLFGKNAQFLGSGTLAGSCTTHCMLWGLLTSFCCVFTGGLVLAVPGSAVACYACGYRSALRAKYNLPEAPCGDLTTHLFCHLCAICQEYREIRERTGNSISSAPNVTPPPVQTMDEP